MKSTMTMLKTSLAGLFLLAGFGVSAQTQVPPGPITPLGPQNTSVTSGNAKERGEHFDPTITDFSNELINSILFYNPTVANGFTLRASTVEDHASRELEFTTYNWYYDGDGSTPSTTPIAGENGVTLAQTNLAPGYHHYRVEGFITIPGVDPDEICPADITETFVVFVLPPLSVTASHTGTDPALLQYCESDAATQQNVLITPNVVYDAYTGQPDLDGFELKYTWYAVKSNHATNPFATDNGDFPAIDPTKADITGADLQDEAFVIGTAQAFAPALEEIGSYKFFVEVEYTLKDRNYDSSEVDPVTNRARTHVIHRGWFGGADQDNASIVFVTPRPGKPHITIEQIID